MSDDSYDINPTFRGEVQADSHEAFLDGWEARHVELNARESAAHAMIDRALAGIDQTVNGSKGRPAPSFSLKRGLGKATAAERLRACGESGREARDGWVLDRMAEILSGGPSGRVCWCEELRDLIRSTGRRC